MDFIHRVPWRFQNISGGKGGKNPMWTVISILVLVICIMSLVRRNNRIEALRLLVQMLKFIWYIKGR